MEVPLPRGDKIEIMKPTLHYNLSNSNIEDILSFLEGRITSRGLGSKLNISHQQAINMTTRVVREWVQQGWLRPTNKLLKEVWPDDNGMRYEESALEKQL